MRISAPLTDEVVARLRAGYSVLVSGVIYVARDAAHARLVASIEADQPLPIEVEGQIIYYMGPSPAKPGHPIGSAGPTTSYRMDLYTPALLQRGLKGMIGKGNRGRAVREALQRYGAVYLASVGGAAALMAQCVRSAEVVAYPDLGPEAIRRLVVIDLPAIVINDIYGADAYEAGKAAYRRQA